MSVRFPNASQTLLHFASLLAVALLIMTAAPSARADCTGEIRNKMSGAYTFKVFKVGADEQFVEVQSGDLEPGASVTIDYKASYGTQVVQIFQNGKPAFSRTLHDENLAACNFGRSGGQAPFCLGIPRDEDITILARRYNCSKNKAQ